MVLDPHQLASSHVQSADDVVLLVLAGRDDPSLPALECPVAADAWVHVDVDLVLVVDGFHGAGSIRQLAQKTQSLLQAFPRLISICFIRGALSRVC